MPGPVSTHHECSDPQYRARCLTVLDNLIDCYKKDSLHDQDVDPACVAGSESLNLSDMCLLLTSRTPVGLIYAVGQAS